MKISMPLNLDKQTPGRIIFREIVPGYSGGKVSEHQYYEFQAIDRPLTRQQISELRGYSTRAEITPTRFVNSYNWGSFKGDAAEWMEKYFDAHLYLANWGTRVVMLRIQERLLDEEILDEYCGHTGFSFYLAADSFVLSFTSEYENYDYSEEDEGSLSSILACAFRPDAG
jgi:hypothetical protein